MWRLTKPQMKAECGWRKRNKQTLEQRERVSGALLVCQSPSIPSTMQPRNKHWQSPHTTTHEQYMCFADPLSPHFETLKTGMSKGSVSDSLLQPSRKTRRTVRLLVRRVAATTRGIKSLTDIHDAFRFGTSTLSMNTGVRAFKGPLPPTCAFKGPAWRCMSTWVCVWECSNVWGTLAPVHTDRQLCVILYKKVHHLSKSEENVH